MRLPNLHNSSELSGVKRRETLRRGEGSKRRGETTGSRYRGPPETRFGWNSTLIIVSGEGTDLRKAFDEIENVQEKTFPVSLLSPETSQDLDQSWSGRGTYSSVQWT